MKKIFLLITAAVLFTSLVYGQSDEKMYTLYNEGTELYN